MDIRRGPSFLVISAIILAAFTVSARAAIPLDAHQHMPLINIGGGKCFEPTPENGVSNSEGLLIQQRTCSSGVMTGDSINRKLQYYQFQSQGYVAYNDQSWCHFLGCIEDRTIGYLIRNLESDRCFEVRDGTKASAAVIQQSICRDRNARSMMWYVQDGDWPGVFKVRNFNSDLCLDVRGGSRADFAQLQQYRCTRNNLSQNFTQEYLGTHMDLSGRWTDGSSRSAVISSGRFGHIVIDMSAFGRPAALGSYVLSLPTTIRVKFPDDATFEGNVSPLQVRPTRITWTNGSAWARLP
jgi:hypothetical protein